MLESSLPPLRIKGKTLLPIVQGGMQSVGYAELASAFLASGTREGLARAFDVTERMRQGSLHDALDPGESSPARAAWEAALRGIAEVQRSLVRTLGDAERSSALDRLAQRACRQDSPVGEPLVAVDREQVQVLGHARVLVPVIHHHDIGAGGRCCAQARRPVARHPAGCCLRQQQGLVADLGGAMARAVHRQGAGLVAAIAAAEGMRTVPQLEKAAERNSV